MNWDVDKPRDQWLFDYPAQARTHACFLLVPRPSSLVSRPCCDQPTDRPTDPPLTHTRHPTPPHLSIDRSRSLNPISSIINDNNDDDDDDDEDRWS